MPPCTAFVAPLAGLCEIGLFFASIFLMRDDSLDRKGGNVKIGMQYGKLITDSRFYKPQK